MRVVVERGAVGPDELARVVRGLAVDVAFVTEATERSDDFVVRCSSDLERLGARLRPPLQLGDLEATPSSATFAGIRLALPHLEAAVLYELVAANGAPIARGALHSRCWSSETALRNVDVAVCRLRAKLEHATNLRLYNRREVGYWLDTSKTTKCVLVVEDDTTLHNGYCRTFASLGVDVDFVTTYAECAKVVEQRVYDGYFVDLQLPGGPGADLIPLIQRRAPQAPIMIVTGRSDPQAVALSASFGVPYALKPFKTRELTRFVERAVLRHACP